MVVVDVLLIIVYDQGYKTVVIDFDIGKLRCIYWIITLSYICLVNRRIA